MDGGITANQPPLFHEHAPYQDPKQDRQPEMMRQVFITAGQSMI